MLIRKMKFRLIKVDYDIVRDNNINTFTACILARNQEEILKFLRQRVSPNIRIISLSDQGIVDALATDFEKYMENVIVKSLLEQGKIEIKKPSEQKDVSEQDKIEVNKPSEQKDVSEHEEAIRKSKQLKKIRNIK